MNYVTIPRPLTIGNEIIFKIKGLTNNGNHQFESQEVKITIVECGTETINLEKNVLNYVFDKELSSNILSI